MEFKLQIKPRDWVSPRMLWLHGERMQCMGTIASLTNVLRRLKKRKWKVDGIESKRGCFIQVTEKVCRTQGQKKCFVICEREIRLIIQQIQNII